MDDELFGFWRRLDVPGHDVCRLRTRHGTNLRGTAVFRHEDGPVAVDYSVDCDDRWQSERGQVNGHLGGIHLSYTIERKSRGIWSVNGQLYDSMADCVDLDFGFTPATNVLQLRRAAMKVGERGEFNVAWFDVPEGELKPVPQIYTRLTESSYQYDSPVHGYSAVLEIAESGFVREYPGLWVAE